MPATRAGRKRREVFALQHAQAAASLHVSFPTARSRPETSALGASTPQDAPIHRGPGLRRDDRQGVV